jgi:Family of unknown function (DUF6172)
MKKTFSLIHPRIKRDRMVESVRHDIKKYLKRERNKKLPENADFWDFACKFGPDAESAEDIHLSAIGKAIDEAVRQQLDSFYVEILARPGQRTKKPDL